MYLTLVYVLFLVYTALTGQLEPVPLHGLLSLIGLDIIIYKFQKIKSWRNKK